MSDLRTQLIRLAYEKPGIRKKILPLLKEATREASDDPWRSALDWLGGKRRLKMMIGAKHFAHKGPNQFSFYFPHKKQKHYCTITVSLGRTYDEYNYEMEIKNIRAPRAKVVNVSEEEARERGIRPGRHKLPPGDPVVKIISHKKNLMGEDLPRAFSDATGLVLSL